MCSVKLKNHLTHCDIAQLVLCYCPHLTSLQDPHYQAHPLNLSGMVVGIHRQTLCGLVVAGYTSGRFRSPEVQKILQCNLNTISCCVRKEISDIMGEDCL